MASLLSSALSLYEGFRVSRYIITGRRTPERETFKEFFDTLKTGMNAAAADAGFSINWEAHPLYIRDLQIAWDGLSPRVRLNLNTAAQGAITFTVHHKERGGTSAGGSITLRNSSLRSSAEYFIQTPKGLIKSQIFMEHGPMDFYQRQPEGSLAREKITTAALAAETFTYAALTGEYKYRPLIRQQAPAP